MADLTPLPAAAPANRLRRAAGAALNWSVGLAAGAFALLFVAWLALHWAILPHIENWRPLIEREAGQALGVMVRVGSIEVRSSGWVPTVELGDVKLLDAQGRPALEVGRAVASVSARSLLASLASLELRLSQLVVDGVHLDVRRDAAGRLFVAGLDLSGATGGGGTTDAADWILHQGEIAVRGATLRWTDEQRGAPPLELTAVDLVVRNTLRRHALLLNATPPAAWGERFSLRGDFTQPLLERSGAWQRWSGQIYADAPRADASQLRRYIDLPFELAQGVGALRAWIEVREGVGGALTLDAALRAVELRLASGLEPLVVEELQGRLIAQRRADGGSIALRNFGFVAGDGVRWPAGDLDFAWTRNADGSAKGGTFSAGRLDLALIADTAARLPLGAPVRKLLAETRPQGIASAVRASWSGPLDAPAQYRVSAQLESVSVAAMPAPDGGTIGRPGFANAGIELDATERGGEAHLAMKNGSIDLPGLLAEPVVPMDELSAHLIWRIDEPAAGGSPTLQLQVRGAQLANADARAEINATWSSGSGDGVGRGGRLPGLLELDGTLTQGVATRAARYLPLGLAEGTRRYLQRALRGGTVKRATFRVNGDLWDFPQFAAGTPGEFRVAIDAEDVTFAYVPSVPAGDPSGEPAFESPWPPMTQASGEIVLDRTALELRGARARILGVDLSGLRGGVRDLTARPVLQLDALGRGPVADMLRFVNATPAGDGIRGALHDATAAGDGELKLALQLPLQDLAHTSVGGSLQLPGNDLRLRADLPPLGAARGRVDFSANGFTVTDATARVLGGDVTIGGGTQADGSLRFTLQGRASAEALRQAGELGSLARLAGALSGQANYRLALGIVKGTTEVDLTSDLLGLASEFPPPLAKRADTALPLRLHSERSPTGAAQDSVSLDLGSVLHAVFVRDISGDTPRVLRGGIGVFAPAPTPASGVAAVATLANLDIDAWDAAAARWLGPVGSDPGAADAYLPTQIGLEAQTLAFACQRLSRVTAGLSRQDGRWLANVDAEQLSGHIEYRPGGAAPGDLRARLTRLAIARSESDEVTQLLDRQPASVPALDIVIDEFALRGRQLGRLEMQAVNRLVPERQWELSRLTLALPEARFSASGRWVATSTSGPRAPGVPARRAEYSFELSIADSGALLGRFGNPDAIRGGKG